MTATELRASVQQSHQPVYRDNSRSIGHTPLVRLNRVVGDTPRPPQDPGKSVLQGPDFLQQAGAARRQIREVDPGELKDLLAGGATLIDVREEKEFEAGHIPGARHVNGSTLRSRLTGS